MFTLVRWPHQPNRRPCALVRFLVKDHPPMNNVVWTIVGVLAIVALLIYIIPHIQ